MADLPKGYDDAMKIVDALTAACIRNYPGSTGTITYDSTERKISVEVKTVCGKTFARDIKFAE